MSDHLAAAADHDPAPDAPVTLPAQPRTSNRGARFPGEVIKQRRTFRIGLQFAPLAACVAMPPVLGSLLNPDFLYVRSLQLLALAAVIIAGTGVYLLCHGLSRKSHRLHSAKFWCSIGANIAILAAIAGASARAYRYGHAPPVVPSVNSEE